MEKPTATFIKAEEFQVLHCRGNYIGGGTNKDVCDCGSCVTVWW